ncbi:MAG: glycosyltransferase [Glaciimonas sp.]|nr:glycosyltransferase [Glaciimonas sp.]
MKILLIGEYSGLHKELKGALIEMGHQVTLAAANDFWKNFDSDINLGHGSNIYSYKARQIFLPLLNLKHLQGYDVVHLVNFYIIPRFPLLNLLLIKFLKRNNGVVTLSGAGDDPFFVKYSDKTMRYSPIPSHEKFDRGGRYYMRSERHLKIMHEYLDNVDGVIPIMYEYYSTFCAAGYAVKTSVPIPIPINCDQIKFQKNVFLNKITFFHGLNRPGFKGTHIIEKCFSELMRKYPSDVECIIAGKLPFSKYMEVLSKVNVSVDQVYSYSLGMNALYSMAQGKVVVGGAEPESSILYEGELPPVYNALPGHESLMGVFEKILDERKDLNHISIASRDFVAAKHAPALSAAKYINYWNSFE